MAEIQFVRTFLAALDSRPLKLPADYAEDPKGYPSRSPYILPRMPKAMQKTTQAKLAPGQDRSAVVSVKSLHRAPPLDIRLDALPLTTTSLLDVRQALATQTHVPVAKLKLLHNKKPVPDSKVLKDLVGDSAGSAAPVLELTLMVVGGAATVAAAQAGEEASASPAAAAAPTPTPSAAAEPMAVDDDQNVLDSETFWTDLRQFLVGRIKKEKQADEAFSLFLRAWEERSE